EQTPLERDGGQATVEHFHGNDQRQIDESRQDQWKHDVKRKLLHTTPRSLCTKATQRSYPSKRGDQDRDERLRSHLTECPLPMQAVRSIRVGAAWHAGSGKKKASQSEAEESCMPVGQYNWIV